MADLMAEHTLKLSESDRQATLMALAHLAVERPGWDMMLSEIAQRIDNPGPELYERFKTLRKSNLELDEIETIESFIEDIQKPKK
jgi:hypothetical protein